MSGRRRPDGFPVCADPCDPWAKTALTSLHAFKNPPDNCPSRVRSGAAAAIANENEN